MPILLCRHFDRRTEWRVSVADGDITIGYSEAADVPVPDPTIAAKELLIYRKGDRYLLQDLSEKGRVLLGGTVTRAGLLKDGDRLRVGRVSVIFYEDHHSSPKQVELFRDGAPAETDPRLQVFSGDLERGSPPRMGTEAPAALPIRWVLGVLAASLVAGIFVGIVVTREPKETQTAPPARPLPPSGARPLDDALRQLKETLAKREAQVEPHVSGERDALKIELGKLPDGAASRVALFRLFLDLAGRPPTRGEARELSPLGHEARWRAILEIARREGRTADLAAPVDAQFREWLSRAPSAAELKDVTGRSTPERPAAFWISASEEYRRDARRRARGPVTRARSLIVDILDRPPRSPAEVETVRDALEAPGGALEAARTLVYSAEAEGEPPHGQDAWWEDEMFRFLLRQPEDHEREEIRGILSALDPGVRKPWLLLALASLEGYGSY